MNLTNLLKDTGVLNSISRELGVDPQSAQTGAEALLPAILGGFKNQAQPAAGGLDGLAGMLGGLGGGALLDAVISKTPTPVESGNAVLGQIFGSRDVSRAVADQASKSTGLDPALLKKMLPILAMAVAGYMASGQKGVSSPALGGLGGMLGQVLGGLGGGAGKAAPGGNLGALASMIDLNGDGNPLDDILGMAGKLRK